MTEYHNPRMTALVPNDRAGSSVKLWIEQVPGKGERVIRQASSKPTRRTYCRLARIVDGDDGKLYFMELAAEYDHITIIARDLIGHVETRFPGDAGYTQWRAMLDHQATAS